LQHSCGRCTEYVGLHPGMEFIHAVKFACQTSSKGLWRLQNGDVGRTVCMLIVSGKSRRNYERSFYMRPGCILTAQSSLNIQTHTYIYIHNTHAWNIHSYVHHITSCVQEIQQRIKNQK